MTNNALTTKSATAGGGLNYSNVPMMNPDTFDHMYRVARMMGMSPMFPDHLRKGGQEAAAANAMLVVNMAMRLNEDPLTVAQQIYFVGGKPGWNTTYMIARANQSGVFKSQIDWKVEGKGTDNLSVTAFATLSGSGNKVSVTCDMAMAKAEGWTSNKKYQTIPEQMLRYRSAAFLIRLYAPEVMIGVPAAIEVELAENEYRDITPPRGDEDEPQAAPEREQPKPQSAKKAQPKAKDAPKPEPKAAAPADDSHADDGQKDDDGGAEYRQLESKAEDILADIADAPSVDAALEFHTDTLARFKEVAKDLHEWVMGEAKAQRAGAAQAEDGKTDDAPEDTGEPAAAGGGSQWAVQITKAIKNDLAECVGDVGVDEVLDVYSAELKRLEDEAPDLFAGVKELGDERRNAV